MTTRTGVSTLTVRIDHGSAPTASLLHVRIQVASSSGWWNGTQVRYGDGQAYQEPGAAVSCPVPPPSGTPPPAGPSMDQRDLLVSYRVAGTYAVDVRAVTDSPCAPGPREELHAQLKVVVTPGPRLVNGPQQPGTDASIGGTPVRGSTELEAFQLTDPDGVVKEARWELGDGTRVTTRLTGGCTDPRTRWPIDKSNGYSRLFHRYSHHGTYRVRVTVVSGGCHGSGRQSRTVTARIRV